MADQRRFRLTLRADSFSLGNDGSLNVWVDRGDMCNLQHDCSMAMLDDDLEEGLPAALELVK